MSLKQNSTNLQSILTTINNLPNAGSGEGDVTSTIEKDFIEGTLLNYSNSVVTTIRDSAFVALSNLISVNFPECEHIGKDAFRWCSALTTAIFPKCVDMSSNAFNQCSSLATISFPKCVSIGTYCFNTCRALKEASFPECITIDNSAFNNCYSLTTVSFPKCTAIVAYAFYGCSTLASASFPKCTNIGSYAFRNCSVLSQIYLEASTVCTLAASNAFSGTSIWSNKGSIFVPASLLASYKAATNWVFFSKRIYSM